MQILKRSNMKNLIYLSIYFCLAFICPTQAQYFERNFQEGFYNQATELREGKNGEMLFSVVSNQPLSFRNTHLYRVDSQGNTIHFSLFFHGVLSNSDWIPLADGYVMTAYTIHCDFPELRYLARYNATGTLLWKKSLELDGEPTEVPMKLLPGPDSTFWLFRADKPPVQFNAVGNILGQAAVALPLFDGYAERADGLLVTYGPSGLAVYSPGLDFVQLGFPGQPILKACPLSDGRLVVLTADKLLIVNSVFGVLQELNHGVQFPDLQVDMAANDASIWLVGATSAGRRLLRYDLSLHLLETKTMLPTTPFQPSFVVATASRLVLLGAETMRSQVVSLRSMPADAVTFDATPDAALTEITTPHLPIGTNYDNYHTVHFDSVAVTLENQGMDTLQRVTINAVLASQQVGCNLQTQFRRSFSDLQLLPGQSISLYLGPIYWASTQLLAPQTSLCFWTTLPNDSLDHNAMNNMVCRTFQVIVPTAEPDAAEPVRIFPNPAHTICTLEWPDQGVQTAQIKVINMAGQKVVQTTVSKNQWNFERNGLPAGIYQVLIINEKGHRFIGKVYFQ